MIKLNRPPEPNVLSSNKKEWLSDLEAAVQKYGSYTLIPDAEKERLVCHYRHRDIKGALELSSQRKCAFCEAVPGDSGNVEVEHYFPKSIYHHLTFEWGNLLPSCRLCNGSKGAHDTRLKPIVNPYNDNPNDYFYFRDIKLIPRSGGNQAVAKETIDVCGLNGIRLMRPRANLLLSTRQFIGNLEDAISSVAEADSARSKAIRLRKLREAIDQLEDTMRPSAAHSSFIRAVVENEEAYKEAVALLAQNP